MKKVLLCSIVTVSMISSVWATTSKEVTKRLIPAGEHSATWESECAMSMKGIINVNSDKKFNMRLKAYTTSNCEEGTDYITLTRTGKYKYQAPVNTTVKYDNGNSYTYQLTPAQLNLDLSPVELDSRGTLGILAEGLISMYDGCIGTNPEREKSKKCIHSGISKTKSRIKLSNMTFITPTKIMGVFRNDVNIEFSLVK